MVSTDPDSEHQRPFSSKNLARLTLGFLSEFPIGSRIAQGITSKRLSPGGTAILDEGVAPSHTGVFDQCAFRSLELRWKRRSSQADDPGLCEIPASQKPWLQGAEILKNKGCPSFRHRLESVCWALGEHGERAKNATYRRVGLVPEEQIIVRLLAQRACCVPGFWPPKHNFQKPRTARVCYPADRLIRWTGGRWSLQTVPGSARRGGRPWSRTGWRAAWCRAARTGRCPVGRHPRPPTRSSGPFEDQ